MAGWHLEARRYDEIRAEVADLIEDYGIFAYPFSLWELIHRMNIGLVSYSLLKPELRTEVAQAWSNAVTLQVVKAASVRHTIFYDDEQSHNRIRFTLAHELGHLVLGHPADGKEAYEHEADIFANYLLAPAPIVIRDSGVDTYTIMVDFAVTHDCAKVVADRTRKRLEYGAVSCTEYEERILSSSHLVKGGTIMSLAPLS